MDCISMGVDAFTYLGHSSFFILCGSTPVPIGKMAPCLSDLCHEDIPSETGKIRAADV